MLGGTVYPLRCRAGQPTAAVAPNTRPLHLSVSHHVCTRGRTWIEDIRSYNGLGSGPFPFPIISDEERQLAKKLGMIDPDEPRFDNKPATARAVFIIGPDQRLKLSMLYPGTTGRNFA